MTIWNEARVLRQKQWTESLFSIFIEGEVAPFTAGQFCRIALEIDDKIIPRPYSFVNAPDDPIKEFYYIHVPGGLLSSKLIELKPNDPIFIAKKGAGIFTLKQVQEAQTLWCFATGTAIGVFLSILKTAEPWVKFENIVLVHSVRMSEELSHQETIHSFKEKYPEQFQYVACTSREATPNAIEGRITTAIESGALSQKVALELSPETSSTMICGNPHMVTDTKQLLVDRGFSVSTIKEPGQITIENYWKD